MQNDTCVAAAHTCDRKICMDTVAHFDVSSLTLAVLHRKDLGLTHLHGQRMHFHSLVPFQVYFTPLQYLEMMFEESANTTNKGSPCVF